MLKKILTIIISSALVLTFASCASEEKGNKTSVSGETETSTNNTEETNLDQMLTDDYYDGYNYRMLVRKGYTSTQYLEEDSEDIVESAIFKRNKEVESKYGITISVSESSTNGAETDALNSILAGDDAYDIIFAHSRSVFTYAVQGAAYNINDISTINLENPWWSPDIRNSCNINGNVFVLDGDFSTGGLSNSMVLFFNKRIFDELGFEYPYEMVREGDWTFDEFAYLAKKGAKDLDGDGIMNPEIDQYGFVSGEWEMPIGILYTGGQRIYSKDDEGRLELSLYTNKTVDIYDEFFSLMNNSACFIPLEGVYKGKQHFGEGRAMMQAATLGAAQSYRAMDDDFGILPYPKFDESDDYSSIINGHASMAVIPITVSDVERTGAITEALSAYGREYVIPAFYDVSLKTKAARDDDSGEMMDIIREKTIFDIGYLSGGTFQSCGRDLARNTSQDFASYYATFETSAKKKVDDFNRDYGKFD